MFLFDPIVLGLAGGFILVALVGIIFIICSFVSKKRSKKIVNNVGIKQDETTEIKEETIVEEVVVEEEKQEVTIEEVKEKTKVEEVNVVKEEEKVEETVSKPKTRKTPTKKSRVKKEEVIETKEEMKVEEVNVVEDKAQEVEEVSVDTTKPKKYQGKYEVYQEGSFFKYRLKASNGEVLCVSEMYKTKKGCIDAISTLKKNLEEGLIKIDMDKHGLYKFKLFAKNHRLLLLSANYPTKERAERAKNSFLRFSTTDIIKEIDEVKESLVVENMEVVEAKEEKREVTGIYEILVNEKEYSFVLRANNREILASSDSYTSRNSCLNGIEIFKNSVENGMFYISKDKNNRYQFKLFNKANRLVMIGEAYSTKTQAIKSVGSVRRFALDAIIKEPEKE